MIIVRLFGGIGNQMFQYAAARRLAIKHDVPLKSDIGWFDQMTSADAARYYALGALSVSGEIASKQEIRLLTGESSSYVFNKLYKVLTSLGYLKLHSNIIREKLFSFDEGVLALPNNSYLDGYWQSYKYFIDIEDVIRQEFEFKRPLAGKSMDVLRQIKNTKSVSVHIRRGDYVTNPDITKFHGLCGMDYYHRCISALAAKIKDPQFFIFSDDPAWVRSQFTINYPMTIIDHNDAQKGYEDLQLMSQCQHNIIANSSFSWWGAWLNPNPHKLVYAPKRWFAKTDIDTTDLIPSEWFRL